MDYEKKYKEALERATELNNRENASILLLGKGLEYIFPELKEGEGERIRKEILDYCKNKAEKYPNDPKYKNISAWIAWLEKQSEEARNIALRTEYEKGRADAIAEMSKFKIKYAGSEYNVLEVKDIAGETFYGIEDEPDHIDYVKAENCKIIGGYSIKENGSPYPTKSAVFSEQNFIDKTEPKFHKGEWLQYRNAKPFFVEEITEQGYVNGISCLPFDWENEIHLWTIQDAKPGDVLVVDNIIFIYKRILSSHIVSYCKLINGKFEHFEDARTCCEGNAYVHPATKEQRDLLFQKMKEAGYEWDAEKKVLKKIEQKPEHPYCQEHCKGYKESGGKCYFGFDCEAKREAEKQPAWSEEDENWLINAINVCKLNNYNETADWLKSLKERVQPQPKQEWREEDESKLHEIRCALYDYYAGADAEEIEDWLKSLKDRVFPQNTWKPRDEQLKALNYVVNLMASSESPKENDYYYSVFKDLREQLKELKEE